MNFKAVHLLKHLDIQLYDRKNIFFSKFVHAIRENLTNDRITQNDKHDSQKILAGFIINFFSHKIELIEQARKNFRPQIRDDETVLAEQSDYV